MKHGMRNTRLYGIWLQMKTRCFNPNCERFCDYGGRGIVVCEEWNNDFMSFYNWSMENGYADNLTIDRIDNDGNYEPSNCRWATLKEQARNSRHCNIIEFDGEKHPISEWAEIKGLTRACIVNRLNYGWSVEKALNTPMRKNKKRLFKEDVK